MNKLEVGMYVRTEDGEILKIKYIEDVYTSDDIYIAKVIYFGDSFHINSDAVIKASHNIIDILEEGDYVNGCKVKAIFPKTRCENQCIKLKGEKDLCYVGDIRTIVTKEQFSQMEYKVGE